MKSDLVENRREDSRRVGQLRNRKLRNPKRGIAALVLMTLVVISGCSRPFWREQAERDSYDAITENLTDQRWAVPRIDIIPDPRSRFYDPHDPDYAPLPPDDPDAHVYMHWVDGWQGYNCWHQFGDLLSVENPQWLLPFALNPEQYDEESGQYVGPQPLLEELTLGEALELALIHNRDYQTQIETVFLAALAVTGERYRFAVQYVGGTGRTPGGGIIGTFMPEGGRDDVSMSSRAGIGQLLPTGGQWFVELVNNTIWLFGGGNETQTASTLSFALTQPLLRGAGRKVVLESLTQRERELLYEVRDLARFRRTFFTNVVGGPNGYLTILRQQQQIRNTESNIFRLEQQVEALQAISSQRPNILREPLAKLPDDVDFPDSVKDSIEYDQERGQLIWYGPMTSDQEGVLAGLSDDGAYQRAIGEIIQNLSTTTVSLDVLRLQSQLATTINGLRESERRLQDTLDQFKLLLGLHTDFLMTIDDELLEQFQLLDPQLVELELEIVEFIPYWGELDENEPDRKLVQAVAERFQELEKKSREIGLSLVRDDFEKLKPVFKERMQTLETDALKARLDYDVKRDRRLFDDAVFQMEEIAEQTATIAEKSAGRKVPIDTVKRWVLDLKDYQEDLLKTVQSLQAVQIGLRVELVELNEYDLSMEESVDIAIENRLDLKNARADVMDARRQIEVAANALKSVLDLEVRGDFRTPSLGTFNTNAFEFEGDLSDISVGLSFDTPLDQIAERNIYEQSLINYQRARRSFMLAEDQVKQDVRTAWRQLEVQRKNLETSRQAVRIAVAQFDSSVEQAYAPARVGQQPTSGTAGLQGQNIQNALNSILRAQNDIVGIWVGYEQNRLNIHRDMGIMDVGPDNIWNDSFYREQTASMGETGGVYGGGGLDCPINPDGSINPNWSASSGLPVYNVPADTEQGVRERGVRERGEGGIASPREAEDADEPADAGQDGPQLPLGDLKTGLRTNDRISSAGELRIFGTTE